MTSFLRGFSDAARAGVLTATPDDVVATPEQLRLALPEGVRVLYVTPAFVESRHLVGLFVDRQGRTTAVAKTPRRSWDGATVRAEAAALVRLVELAPELADTVPPVLACADWYGRPVLLEGMLHGQPLTHARVRRDSRAALAVLNWIGALPTTGRTDAAVLVSDLLAPELLRLRSLADPADPLVALADRTEQALRPLQGAVLPRVFEHGDPSHPNLLIDSRSGSRDGGPRVEIVDWELARADGAPGHDLAQYLAFVCFARAGVHGTRDETAVFEASFGSDGVGMARFSAGLAARGVPVSLARPLLVLAWARAALRLLPRLAAQESAADAVPSGSELVELLTESRNASLWRAALDLR